MLQIDEMVDLVEYAAVVEDSEDSHTSEAFEILPLPKKYVSFHVFIPLNSIMPTIEGVTHFYNSK